MTDISLLRIIITMAASIPAGILAGNGAVYVFNHLPAGWLGDMVVREPGDQRVKSVPWKAFFTAAFIVICIFAGTTEDPRYAVTAVISVWLLLMLGLADKKYGRCPAQLTWLLLITGIGYIPFSGLKEMALGAGAGAGGMLVIWIIGRLVGGRIHAVDKSAGLQGDDRAPSDEDGGVRPAWEPYMIGFGAAVGLACGWRGALTVLVIGGIIRAVSGLVHLAGVRKRKAGYADVRRYDMRTRFVADICIAAAVYIIVLHKYI